MDEPRQIVIHNGSCIRGACGEEAACKEFENNTYTCVCPHDSRPPTFKGTCPRKIVPVDPGRIPNVQPPSNKQSPFNSTYPRIQQSTAINVSQSTLITAGLTSLFVIVLIIFSIYIKNKFRSRASNNSETSPINLKQSLLMSERYTPNPQYSACIGTGVPLLRKEALKFLNEVGEGCFGKVYKGELQLESSEEEVQIVAIKVLKDNATKEAEEDFIREVEIMSAFRHPNILSLLGMVLRENNVSPMMVFEYMPHGDLAELLRAQKSSDSKFLRLTWVHLASIALQIASGMKYLAAQRFVHRDLACRNCLVAAGPVVKIADFGMSRDVYTCDYYKIGGSRLLPVRWMSPESVLYGRFTLESDIWSYGVVLWEIYSFGKQPYYGHTNEEAVKLILDGIMLIPPEDCPPFICELMKNCWKTEPKDRIKFANICDKLEIIYESFEQNAEYENERKTVCRTTRTLPRPPPLPMIRREDLLDAQGYLLANEVKEPVQYLKTLP